MLPVQTGCSFAFPILQTSVTPLYYLTYQGHKSLSSDKLPILLHRSCWFSPSKNLHLFFKPIIACMLLGVCCNCLCIKCETKIAFSSWDGCHLKENVRHGAETYLWFSFETFKLLMYNFRSSFFCVLLPTMSPRPRALGTLNYTRQFQSNRP